MLSIQGHNQLWVLPPSFFDGLTNLVSLDLTNNKVERSGKVAEILAKFLNRSLPVYMCIRSYGSSTQIYGTWNDWKSFGLDEISSLSASQTRQTGNI